MKIFRQTLLLSVIAFSLHLLWENIQAPLYAGYLSFNQHLLICLFATMGDVLFTLVVYFGVGLLKQNFNWISGLNKKDSIVLATVGLFFAMGIEWRALLLDRWSYSEAMLVIPYLKVGLTPILQMTLLLPLSFYLAKIFNPKQF